MLFNYFFGNQNSGMIKSLLYSFFCIEHIFIVFKFNFNLEGSLITCGYNSIHFVYSKCLNFKLRVYIIFNKIQHLIKREPLDMNFTILDIFIIKQYTDIDVMYF